MTRLLSITVALGLASSALAEPAALPAPKPEARCDKALGKASNGATAVWQTQLTFQGEQVSGTETQHLLANPTWKSNDGADCSVVYVTTGTKAAAVGCPSCAFSLQLAMQVDPAKSSCPEGLTPKDASDPDWSYEVTYQVSLEGEETVVRFASGTELGRGKSDEGSLAIQTAPRCRWF